MADPVSITSLVLQLGSVIKKLYVYGKAVKDAQKDIIDLCGELSSLKSVLADLETQGSRSSTQSEIQWALESAKAIVDDLAEKLHPKTASTTKRVLQSLAWPFDHASVRATLTKLERLKSGFLLKLMTDSQSATEDLRLDIANLTTVVKDEIADRKQERDESALEVIRKHLAPVSPQSAHRKACETWQGTMSGSWFWTGAFRKWTCDDKSMSCVLWLTGRSGSGKTTIISQAIEKLRKLRLENSDIKLGYHYCTHNNIASQEPSHILGSWLVQVAGNDPSMLDKYKQHMRDEVPAVEIEESLSTIEGPTFLVLDAINESFKYQKVAESVEWLSKQSSNIKILVSTTPMFEFPLTHARIDMRPDLMLVDIEIYIKRRIAEHRILRAVPEEKFLNALLPRADGMFRWVDCQLSALAAQRTPQLVLKALGKLPGSLDDTYAAILSRVQDADKDLVREALLWLCYSRRPLTLDELCESVVVDESQSRIDETCRLTPPYQLIEMCQGLIDHDPRTGVVALSHSSVRTFLTGSYIKTTQCAAFALDEPESQRSIVRKSLTYLLLENFKDWFKALDVNITHWLHEYPLLSYAANHWCLHARACQDGLTVSEFSLIDTLLLTHRTHRAKSLFTFWVRCLSPLGFEEERPDAHKEYLENEDLRDFLEAAEPLYYMASANLEVYVERMFQLKMINRHQPDLPWYINKKCGRMESTALQVACQRGSARLVKLLLKEGADTGWCLCIALLRPSLEIAQILLQHGATLGRDECEDFGLSLEPLNALLGLTKDLQVEIDVEQITESGTDLLRHQVTVLFPNPPTAISFNSTLYDPWTMLKAVPQHTWHYRLKLDSKFQYNDCGPFTRLVMASSDSVKIFPGRKNH